MFSECCLDVIGICNNTPNKNLITSFIGQTTMNNLITNLVKSVSVFILTLFIFSCGGGTNSGGSSNTIINYSLDSLKIKSLPVGDAGIVRYQYNNESETTHTSILISNNLNNPLITHTSTSPRFDQDSSEKIPRNLELHTATRYILREQIKGFKFVDVDSLVESWVVYEGYQKDMFVVGRSVNRIPNGNFTYDGSIFETTRGVGNILASAIWTNRFTMEVDFERSCWKH